MHIRSVRSIFTMRTVRTLRPVVTIASLVLGIGLIAAVLWLRFTGYQFLSVQSGSMAPALGKGDLVLVTYVPPKDLRPGDIVTFISPNNQNTTTTHRIIETPNQETGFRFVTKGDANPAADTSIVPSSIVGKQVHNIPLLGYLADAIRHPIGLLIMIYLPAFWIITSEIKRLQDYYRRIQPYFDPELPIIHNVYNGPRTPIMPMTAAVMTAAIVSSGLYFGTARADWRQRSSFMTGSTITTEPGWRSLAEPPPVPEPTAAPTPAPSPSPVPSPSITPSPKPTRNRPSPTPTPVPPGQAGSGSSHDSQSGNSQRRSRWYRVY